MEFLPTSAPFHSERDSSSAARMLPVPLPVYQFHPLAFHPMFSRFLAVLFAKFLAPMQPHLTPMRGGIMGGHDAIVPGSYSKKRPALKPQDQALSTETACTDATGSGSVQYDSGGGSGSSRSSGGVLEEEV